MSIVAKAMQVAEAKDKNHVVTNMVFYGVIQEIWLFYYFTFKIPVFKCDWVDSKNGIKVDELGFTSVNLGRVGHKSDSFVLASQVKKVFYVPDQLNPKWSIVLSSPQKGHYDENNDEFIDGSSGGEVLANILPNIGSFDLTDESPSTYAREHCEGMWIEQE